eukprot:4889659-Amphidinium_carterae.2
MQWGLPVDVDMAGVDASARVQDPRHKRNNKRAQLVTRQKRQLTRLGNEAGQLGTIVDVAVIQHDLIPSKSECESATRCRTTIPPQAFSTDRLRV